MTIIAAVLVNINISKLFSICWLLVNILKLLDRRNYIYRYNSVSTINTNFVSRTNFSKLTIAPAGDLPSNCCHQRYITEIILHTNDLYKGWCFIQTIFIREVATYQWSLPGMMLHTNEFYQGWCFITMIFTSDYASY